MRENSLRKLLKISLKYPFIENSYRFIFRDSIRQYIFYIINRKKLIKILEKVEKKEKKQVQFPKQVAIIFLARQEYIDYLPKFYDSFKKYFLPKTKKRFFVLTDQVSFPFLKGKKDIKTIKIENEPTHMMRIIKNFEHIALKSDKFRGCDLLIKFDADMYADSLISEKDFFSHRKELFTVRHPNFLNIQGSFEKDSNSLASVNPGEDLSEYVQACFWGGRSGPVIKMAREISKRITIDIKRKNIPKILDESHLNKYFIENKELFYVYDPSYAYPGNRPIPKRFKKKIIHQK